MTTRTLALLLASMLCLAGCSKGDKGERGERGAPGDRGETGPPGPAGSSAIHIRTGRGPEQTFCPLGETVIAAFCVNQIGAVTMPTFISNRREPPTGVACPDAAQTTVYCAIATVARP